MSRRDDRGQTSVLIIGLAIVIAMMVVVVVDASAAYLRRQSLDSLADGAALAGADGVQGEQVYRGGLDERAAIDPAVAGQYVAAYLTDTGARSTYPGLTWRVSASTDSVVVHVRAPLELPLTLPGLVDRASVTADASAIVLVAD